MDYIYVQNENALEKAAGFWNSDLGVDLECENNMHHYGTYISLIQVSNREKNWVIDVIKVNNLQPVKRMLHNPDIQKILHGSDFDLRILNHDLGCRPKNIFDTQLAAQFLNKKDIGLQALLLEYFGIEKKCRFQMADWSKRPLKKGMLDYAATDTRYLLELRNHLITELKAAGRLDWVMQELKHIEETEWIVHEQNFYDLKGLRTMTPQQRSIFKRLYVLREQMASKVNRPVHFVIRTKHLRDISLNPPASVHEWKNLKGVHPIVRRQAYKFIQAVKIGCLEKVHVPSKTIKKFSQRQRDLIKELTEKRDLVADEHNLTHHLLLNKDQIRQVAISGNYDSLRHWQKELLGVN